MDELIAGYRRFRAETWPQQRARFEELAADGQRPHTMVIACSDSRVDPQMIFSAGPGELFVLRNVANLVPPYMPDAKFHGTSAAVEFAVRVLKVGTQRAPSPAELRDLVFAFRVCKHVKSNAIVYAKNEATVGIGGGQPNRVDSARIAGWKSEEAAKAAGLAEPLARGSVVASDAFFPFADGLQAAAAAGATAVIQPGGSMRDGEVIAAADAAGLAMVLTGMRHFRH